MAVGRIGGGGGRSGKAGGAKGSSGPSKVSGPKGAGKFGTVDRTERLVGPSGTAGSANVGQTEPLSARALEIARQLKTGEISSREEATRKLVADILQDRLRLKSKALTTKITEQMQDDPRLNQTLERLWSKG